MSLRVEFVFDRQRLEADGHSEEKAMRIVKNAFSQFDIRCHTEQPFLTFVGGERETDFAHMWLVIRALCKEDWFLTYASYCRWYNEDCEEDVLSYVKERIRKAGST